MTVDCDPSVVRVLMTTGFAGSIVVTTDCTVTGVDSVASCAAVVFAGSATSDFKVADVGSVARFDVGLLVDSATSG